MSPTVFSFGGGRQSTAVLVLAARREIEPFDAWLFADVGHDSENPETLRYLAEHSGPYAAAHGLDLRAVRWDRRGGYLTLLQYLEQMPRQIPIPVSFGTGGPSNRKCTNAWKIDVVAREHRRLGATPEQPGACGIGISVDEISRARTDSKHPWQTPAYPLLDLGLTKDDCAEIVASAGLPPAPRSSCWFCPFNSVVTWIDRRRAEPELYDRAVELERMLSDRAVGLGKDPCTLHPHGTLPDVTAQLSFDDLIADPCSGSSCFT